MARSRNIKPGFFLNDELAEIEPLGRLLFAGLWTVADREGRLRDSPKKIKACVLPYDDCDVEELLNELRQKKFIARYSANDENYIAILNWKKHQNPHIKEVSSEIPGPNEEQIELALNENHTSTVQEQVLNSTKTADSLNLDSLNLDSLSQTNKFADDAIEVILAKELSSHIKNNNPECGSHDIQSWAADFDKIIRIDKRPIERIREIMEFSQKDEFWHTNIRCPSKLRKQFDALILKSKSSTKKIGGALQGEDAQAMLRKQREQYKKKDDA